jgi:RNA polymerase sigma-70 factor, ECF subfamily
MQSMMHQSDLSEPGDLHLVPLSDTELVKASIKDRQAFATLFERYWDQVYRYCYYHSGNWSEAEDTASQVFVSALGTIDRFRNQLHDGAFRCWLFTIARNQLINTQRWHVRHQAQNLESAYAVPGDDPSPEEAALEAERHAYLHRLITTLKPDQRDLLELRLAGLTDKEIAEVLGRSHAAVRKAQSRVLADLRTQHGAISETELFDGQ